MKLVGLAVVANKDNFGSALQTFATQKVIREMGYDTKVFDISQVKGIIEKRKLRYYFTRIIHKDEREYLFSVAHSLLKKKNNDDTYAKNMAIRHEQYSDFYKNNIVFFPRAECWEDLTEQAKQCDAVLVGSDQLWGAANIEGRYYTLEFVPDEIKKIAYSTSIGTSSLPKQLHKHARYFLNRFEYLSIREVTGQKIVKNLTGLDIPVVCDPTMLMDANEWMTIQSREPFTKGDYILTYFMGDNPVQRRFVERLKIATGYKIVGLLHGSTYIKNDEGYCDETPYNVGPGEFLNLIRNAKFVCTDSFHCCVFSIIYGTEFYVFRRDADDNSFGTIDRLHTLLGWTGLEDRLLIGDEDVSQYIEKRMDIGAVQKRIDENRRRSLSYLRNALE